MNRNLALAGGSLLLLAVVGGVLLLGGSSPPVSNTTTSPGPFATTTDEQSEPVTEIVVNPEDPGQNSYPRNPSSPREELIGSKQISEHLVKQINLRRGESNLNSLSTYTTLRSMTRTHSWDMYNRSYVGTVSPDGVTPVERYNGTVTECDRVEEYIFHDEVVVKSDGSENRSVSGETLAANYFYQMLQNETMKSSMLDSNADMIGVGSYISNDSTEDGETRVNVYTTIDYCYFED